ncbi:MAG: PEP-CTERM sorting domain-containing protein [Acidobacteriota bacterium]|nr:PEP-CTERM sorting domain-containing protein [Acidobacteriota bacterium]
MKRMIMLGLIVALPVVAFVSSGTDFSNRSNKLTSPNSKGLTLTGPTLTSVNGLNGGPLLTGLTLSTVNFTSGTFQAKSGSMKLGSSFNRDGTLIRVSGSNALSGVLFAGTLSGPASWELVTRPNGAHNYILTGALQSYGGGTTAVTTQLPFDTGTHYWNGSARPIGGTTTPHGTGIAPGTPTTPGTITSTGTTTATVVPEPGTLSLLATGLLGLAGVIRRQLKA